MAQDLAGLQQELGVAFQEPSLLMLALVHPSYVNEHPEAACSNQRLEFLGDAVVDAIVAEEVYRRFPEAPEGQLTPLRAAVVRDDAVARAGRRLGLGALMQLGQGEEATGGRERPSNLAAAFEAMVGAVFLDQGFNVARRVTRGLLEEELKALSEGRAVSDPKSQLQEYAQQRGKPPPMYRVVQERGPEHAKEFDIEVALEGVVLGMGRGRRKAEAEREAAAQAMAALEASGAPAEPVKG
jgi:ribonuclease-3